MDHEASTQLSSYAAAPHAIGSTSANLTHVRILANSEFPAAQHVLWGRVESVSSGSGRSRSDGGDSDISAYERPTARDLERLQQRAIDPETIEFRDDESSLTSPDDEPQELQQDAASAGQPPGEKRGKRPSPRSRKRYNTKMSKLAGMVEDSGGTIDLQAVLPSSSGPREVEKLRATLQKRSKLSAQLAQVAFKQRGKNETAPVNMQAPRHFQPHGYQHSEDARCNPPGYPMGV